MLFFISDTYLRSSNLFPYQISMKYPNLNVILHRPAKLRQNRTTLGRVITSCPFFSRWRSAAILDLIWVILDHPRL